MHLKKISKWLIDFKVKIVKYLFRKWISFQHLEWGLYRHIYRTVLAEWFALKNSPWFTYILSFTNTGFYKWHYLCKYVSQCKQHVSPGQSMSINYIGKTWIFTFIHELPFLIWLRYTLTELLRFCVLFNSVAVVLWVVAMVRNYMSGCIIYFYFMTKISTWFVIKEAFCYQ